MASEHWCQIHKTKFFKTANMKSYAHPIKDAEAKTIGWCNEDAQEVAKLEPKEPKELPVQEDSPVVKEAVKLGARVTSVDNVKNRAVAISYAKDLVCAGKIELNQMSSYADKFLQYIENIKETKTIKPTKLVIHSDKELEP